MIEFYCKVLAFITADRDEEGATAVEYGLLVALIAAAIMVVVGLLGEQLNTMFGTVLTKLGGTAPADG